MRMLITVALPTSNFLLSPYLSWDPLSTGFCHATLMNYLWPLPRSLGSEANKHFTISSLRYLALFSIPQFWQSVFIWLIHKVPSPVSPSTSMVVPSQSPMDLSPSTLSLNGRAPPRCANVLLSTTKLPWEILSFVMSSNIFYMPMALKLLIVPCTLDHLSCLFNGHWPITNPNRTRLHPTLHLLYFPPWGVKLTEASTGDCSGCTFFSPPNSASS